LLSDEADPGKSSFTASLDSLRLLAVLAVARTLGLEGSAASGDVRTWAESGPRADGRAVEVVLELAVAACGVAEARSGVDRSCCGRADPACGSKDWGNGDAGGAL
jgi:hypothetical protein